VRLEIHNATVQQPINNVYHNPLEMFMVVPALLVVLDRLVSKAELLPFAHSKAVPVVLLELLDAMDQAINNV